MTVTIETRPWNDLEVKVLWAEANRPVLGGVVVNDWTRRNTFASGYVHAAVAMTVTQMPGALSLMEVLRGTPAPSSW